MVHFQCKYYLLDYLYLGLPICKYPSSSGPDPERGAIHVF